MADQAPTCSKPVHGFDETLLSARLSPVTILLFSLIVILTLSVMTMTDIAVGKLLPEEAGAEDKLVEASQSVKGGEPIASIPELELMKEEESVVIAGSLYPGRPEPISKASSNVCVITDDDIKHSDSIDLPTILRRIPGIDVMQRTGPISMSLLVETISCVRIRSWSSWMVALPRMIGVLCTPALSECPPPAGSSIEDKGPLYQPPHNVMPRARVGGGLRGTEGNDPEVQVLVPDHVGFTANKTPVLNWFLSKATKHEVRFTLIDNKSVHRLYEKPIPTPDKPGIYSIQMKDLGLSLEPGVQYRWYVSVIRNSSSPSQDIVGGGVIERCELDECLITMNVVLTCSAESVVQNAGRGFWYDAMGCLCSLIDANPSDVALKRLRARLLKDVGLNSVAEWDLRSIQAQTQ